MPSQILGNIGCYVTGCTNYVIGQCQGYPGQCGRFYCADHSSDIFCLECAHRLAVDQEEKARKEIEEQLFHLYLYAAESVPRVNWFYVIIGMPFLALLFSCGGSLIIGVDPLSDSPIPVAMVFIGYLTAVLYALRKEQKAKKQIAELTALLPNFDKFYAEWLKHKQTQELLAIFAAGIAVAATAATRKRRISEIEEGVKRALK